MRIDEYDFREPKSLRSAFWEIAKLTIRILTIDRELGSIPKDPPSEKRTRRLNEKTEKEAYRTFLMTWVKVKKLDIMEEPETLADVFWLVGTYLRRKISRRKRRPRTE